MSQSHRQKKNPPKGQKINRPKIVSLVGLTASGKSAIGIQLAKQFNGEIISCDSRAVYRGLDIGTAKVMPAEREGVVHHLLDVAEPGEHFDVFKFQKLAYAAIADILSRGRLPILVGGTGLYSRSIVENYGFNEGEPLSVAASKSVPPPSYDFLQICLMPPREYIRTLVEKRIDRRLEIGMLDETRGLLETGVPRDWLEKLGLEYFWNIKLLENRISLDEYKNQLAVKTMQYAKRQRTWFKREKNIRFLTDPNKFLTDCQKLVSEFLA